MNFSNLSNLSRVELLALVKTHNRTHNEKLRNVDILKKDELYDLCKSKNMFKGDESFEEKFDLTLINKKHLLQDIELHFLKKNCKMSEDIMKMKKKELVDYMELNQIQHYTAEGLKNEFISIEKDTKNKHIIYFNIIRKDIDPSMIDTDNIEEFIEEHNLDTNIEEFEEYSTLLRNMYCSFEQFCMKTNRKFPNDKLKSFPKIIQHIHGII